MQTQGLTQRPCARDVYQRLEARALVLDAGAVARVARFLAQLLRDARQHHRRPRLAHQERDQCEEDQRESAQGLALVSHAVGGPRRGCGSDNAPTRGTRTTLLEDGEVRKTRDVHQVQPLDPAPAHMLVHVDPPGDNRPHTRAGHCREREDRHGEATSDSSVSLRCRE